MPLTPGARFGGYEIVARPGAGGMGKVYRARDPRLELGTEITTCRNNEELYEKGKPDAVIISTADFQHAMHAVEAVKAGADAYVEKPFAETMQDAREALRVVRESDRLEFRARPAVTLPAVRGEPPPREERDHPVSTLSARSSRSSEDDSGWTLRR